MEKQYKVMKFMGEEEEEDMRLLWTWVASVRMEVPTRPSCKDGRLVLIIIATRL